MYCKRFRHPCPCPVAVFRRINYTSCVIGMKNPVVCNTATRATYKLARTHIKYYSFAFTMLTICHIILRMYLLFSWLHRHYVLASFIISSFSRNFKILPIRKYDQENENNKRIALDFLMSL